LIAIEQHMKNFLGVRELAFVTFNGFFLEFFTASSLRGCNFLNSIMFLTIFNALDVPIG
jgi:hypothetical protein